MGNKIPEEVSDKQLAFAAKMDSLAHAIQNSDHKELRLSLSRNYFKPKESFYFTFSDSYDALFEIPDITKTDLRVFSKLTKIMDFGNEVPQMTQQQLAELLGMERRNFIRSLNKLVNHGVVIKDGKKLTVNPKYCYKGDLHDRERKLNDLRVAQKRKGNPLPDEPAKPLSDADAKWLDWMDNLISKDNPEPQDSPADDKNDVPF